MKNYVVRYKFPHAFDPGPMGGEDEVVWDSNELRFEALDDDDAIAHVQCWLANNTFEVRPSSSKPTEYYHAQVLSLEEAPRPIQLPDLPQNGELVYKSD